MTEEQRKEMEEKLKNMSPEELKEFQKQQCIFCQIISGKIPSKRIYEDDKVIAILDINPAAKGHILLLPKEHYAIMPQIPEEEVEKMFVIAKKLSQVLLKALKVSGTNIFVANGLAAGQKAQHFMIHVIPRKEGDEILQVEEKLTDEEMRGKVKSLVENKFNELMGVKKEVVEVEDKEVPSKKKKTSKKKEEPKEEEKEEVTESEDSESSDEPAEPEEDTEDNEEVEEDVEEREGTNLDDIANLFK